LPATLETRMYPSAVAGVRPPCLPVHFGRIEDNGRPQLFGAQIAVELVNDGPVTIVLE